MIGRAVGGDADSFGQLYDIFVDRVYRYIHYRVGNTQDTEDLTQQVFLRAWQAIGRYRKTSSPFLAWLMTISHNLVVDLYRSKKDKVYLNMETAAADPASSPERAAEIRSDQQRLRRAILRLPGNQQQVIVMRFIEGFTYAEIAASLGKSEAATRVALHRALKRMRGLLVQEEA